MMASHACHNEKAFAVLVTAEEEQFRWQSEKVSLIQHMLRGLNPRGVLADVGCFTGITTALFRSTGFEKAVGFDVSEEVLLRAATRGIEPRRWRAGEERCPAADGEFDVVVAADVIEHIVDTDTFVDELYRILRPDGRIVVTTPNLAFWISRIRLLIGKPPWSYPGASSTVRSDIMVDLNHIRITTRHEWETLFGARSLVVEDVRGWSLLHAVSGGLGVRVRQVIDRWMTRFPKYAFGLLFLLRKANQV